MESGSSNPRDMQSDPSEPPAPNVFETITITMKFVQRFHSDVQQGNVLMNYSHQEFPLPSDLINFIKDNVLQLEGSQLLQAYLSILTKPNPTDSLIKSFMKSFYSAADKIEDLNVVQWVIMCCLVSAVLHEKGFAAAPNLAIETTRGMVFVHGRQNAFRRFGCGM